MWRKRSEYIHLNLFNRIFLKFCLIKKLIVCLQQNFVLRGIILLQKSYCVYTFFRIQVKHFTITGIQTKLIILLRQLSNCSINIFENGFEFFLFFRGLLNVIFLNDIFRHLKIIIIFLNILNLFLLMMKFHFLLFHWYISLT